MAPTGQTEAQALETLREAGWTGTSADITTGTVNTLDPTMVGRVVNQAEPAGSEITNTQDLTFDLGVLGIPSR